MSGKKWIDEYDDPRDAFECLPFRSEWIAPYLEAHSYERRGEGKYRKRSRSPVNDFMVYHVQFRKVSHIPNLENEFDRMQSLKEWPRTSCNLLFLECSVLGNHDFEKLWEISRFGDLFDENSYDRTTTVIALIESSTEKVYYYKPFKLPGSIYRSAYRLIEKISNAND